VTEAQVLIEGFYAAHRKPGAIFVDMKVSVNLGSVTHFVRELSLVGEEAFTEQKPSMLNLG